MQRVLNHSDWFDGLVEEAGSVSASALIVRDGTIERVDALRDKRRMFEVLAAILEGEDEERYGYELAREYGWPSGSTYKVLEALEADGFITSRQEDAMEALINKRNPRVWYRLTDTGERMLGAWRVVERHRSPASRLLDNP